VIEPPERTVPLSVASAALSGKLLKVEGIRLRGERRRGGHESDGRKR
jgi:hypothetical protein